MVGSGGGICPSVRTRGNFAGLRVIALYCIRLANRIGLGPGY